FVAEREGALEIAGRERGEDVEGDAGADVLDRLEQAEPLALFAARETVELDRLVGDAGLDHQRCGRAGCELGERRGGTADEIADAADIEDRVILRHTVDDAGEFADHRARAMAMRLLVPARWAWAMAAAKASAASDCETPAVGSRRRTI